MLDTSRRTIALLTAAACLGAGSWAVAANTTGQSSMSAATTTQATTPTQPSQTAPQQGRSTPPPQGGQRPDETLLTGTDAEKATAAAEAKLPGATIVRVETDADGGGTYEAHVTRADGSPATVLMDDTFTVTSVLDH